MSERIQNEHSLFPAEIPGNCPLGNHNKARWRTVECKNGRDVIECSRCGQQREQACDFDEEYA
jgi:transcription elongation factor Elf1